MPLQSKPFIALHSSLIWNPTHLIKAEKDDGSFAYQNLAMRKVGCSDFTASDSELIARNMDLHDNVMPASNSVMAKNLFLLGSLRTILHSFESSRTNVGQRFCENMVLYGASFSNWADLHLWVSSGYKSLKITGKHPNESIGYFKSTTCPTLFGRERICL